MKNKIGEATCPDCGFEQCDVGFDKSGHPYRVCWGDECNGAQFFTHGKKPRVRSLLATFRPLPGKASADELRARYGLVDAPAPAPEPESKPAPAPAKKGGGTGLLLS